MQGGPLGHGKTTGLLPSMGVKSEGAAVRRPEFALPFSGCVI